MQRVLVFTEEEYVKLLDFLDEISDDVRCIADNADRAIMAEDMTELKHLLGLKED